MKSTLVRSFVLVLVAAGFTASSISSSAATKTAASKNAMAFGVVGSPTPLCPLNDPKGCGIDPDVVKGK